MRLAVRMPQFGESAAEATVVAWLVQPGSAVAAEQELVEVQTEKSLLTVAAPAAGKLAEQCAAPGDKLAVGDVLAWIEANGVTAPTTPESAVPTGVHTIGTAPAAKKTTASAPPRPAVSIGTAGSGGNGHGHGNGHRHDSRTALRAHAGESAFISPRVWTKLHEAGLKVSDLAMIQGSGAGGRITATDIDHYLSQGEAMSPVRQAVANAMARSWTRPLATVARAAKVDALLAHRRTVAGRPSATVYAMRALALGLKHGNPFACRLYGARLLHPETVDLAVAVEVADGVLTPVVRKVEQLDLATLTTTVEDVIARAQAGRVADAGDAVASVSNYGVFGITWATPIPLPGQGLILGLGAVRSTPDWNPATKSWDRCREIEITLTFDHRIADGGAAGRLLAEVVELLENPTRL